jgi:chemotaxis protein methyltransferase CheR
VRWADYIASVALAPLIGVSLSNSVASGLNAFDVKSTPAALAPPVKTGETREYHFAPRDFRRIRQLIHERAGIWLSNAKQDMVYGRLARRLRVRGLQRFSEYLAILEGGDEAEWEAFTNALTTNLTAFFREEHHFPLLAEHVTTVAKRRPARLWCCASSTGEEPYSIAIALVETFGSFTPPISILATDVDTQVLKKAETGVYALDRLEKMGPVRAKRFFLRGKGVQSGYVRVRPELRNLVSFKRINLLDEAWPVHGPFDAVFCRNVLIYFDRATQSAILSRFAPLLGVDGLLFVGHSESLFHISDLFRLRGKTVYELAKPLARQG